MNRYAFEQGMLLELEKLGILNFLMPSLAPATPKPAAPAGAAGAAGAPVAPVAPGAPGAPGAPEPATQSSGLGATVDGITGIIAKAPQINEMLNMFANLNIKPGDLAAAMKALKGVNLEELPGLITQAKALKGVNLEELPGLIAQAKGAAKYMNADGTPNLGELLSGGLKSMGGLIKDNPLASAAVVGGLGLGAYSLFGNKGNNNNNNNQQTPIQPQVPANQWMANLTKSQGRVDAISPTA